MGEHFDLGEGGVVTCSLGNAERRLLADLLGLLASVGSEEGDPGEARLNPPAYLGDDRAAGEWRRLMRSQLDEGRDLDRSVLRRLVESDGPTDLDESEALSVLRVINEARLALAARLGVEVASDYEDLDLGSTVALHMLGLLVEEITEELSRSL